MARVTFLFLGWLAMATLGAGMAYQNGLNLLRGQADGVSAALFLVGASVFGFALLVLGRVVFLTAPKRKLEE